MQIKPKWYQEARGYSDGQARSLSGVPGYEDLLRNYTTHAAQVLPPIIDSLSAHLGLEDDVDLEAVRGALTQAYMEGAGAGQAESAAQAAEQGVNINVEQLPPSQ